MSNTWNYDSGIEPNMDVTVTEAAQVVLELVQQLLDKQK